MSWIDGFDSISKDGNNKSKFSHHYPKSVELSIVIFISFSFFLFFVKLLFFYLFQSLINLVDVIELINPSIILFQQQNCQLISIEFCLTANDPSTLLLISIDFYIPLYFILFYIVLYFILLLIEINLVVVCSIIFQFVRIRLIEVCCCYQLFEVLFFIINRVFDLHCLLFLTLFFVKLNKEAK